MYKRKTECMVIVSMKPSTEISQKDLLLFQTCMSRYQRDMAFNVIYLTTRAIYFSATLETSNTQESTKKAFY